MTSPVRVTVIIPTYNDASFLPMAVDSALARSLSNASGLIAQFGGAATFLRDGAAPAPGTLLRQPALARTLERIAAGGADGFYRGETARAVAADPARTGSWPQLLIWGR